MERIGVDYRGADITYYEITNEWSVTIDGRGVGSAASLAEARKMVDAHEKREAGFERFKVYRLNVPCDLTMTANAGTATSIVESVRYGGTEAWVTWEDSKRRERVPVRALRVVETDEAREALETVKTLWGRVLTLHADIRQALSNIPTVADKLKMEAEK